MKGVTLPTETVFLMEMSPLLRRIGRWGRQPGISLGAQELDAILRDATPYW